MCVLRIIIIQLALPTNIERILILTKITQFLSEGIGWIHSLTKVMLNVAHTSG